ncbi:hypothetical protein Peur_005840 [Populus x canadensis]
MQPNTPLINQSNQKHLRCATELQAAGIRIKGGRAENLLDIKFVSGFLEIPPRLPDCLRSEEVNLNESYYDGLFDQVEEHKGTRTTWHLLSKKMK